MNIEKIKKALKIIGDAANKAELSGDAHDEWRLAYKMILEELEPKKEE